MLKKILAFFICFNLIITPAFCVIHDDFVEKTLAGKNYTNRVQNKNIQDVFVEKTLSKTNYKKNSEIIIRDTFAESNINKKQYVRPNVQFDEDIIKTSRQVVLPKKNLISEKETSIPVKLQIQKYFSTKHKIDEGDFLEFKTISEIKIKNKTYPAGSIVKARVETISHNKIWGVPADLVVGNFSLEGIPLAGEINKTGANRSLWLYPTVYSTIYFFGVGLLLIPIRGGHAKIKPHQIYTVYYSN